MSRSSLQSLLPPLAVVGVADGDDHGDHDNDTHDNGDDDDGEHEYDDEDVADDMVVTIATEMTYATGTATKTAAMVLTKMTRMTTHLAPMKKNR